MTVKIEITLPDPPEGFEYTGEYRVPRNGEWFFDDDDSAFLCRGEVVTKWHILRKVSKRWRAKKGKTYLYLDTAFCVDENICHMDGLDNLLSKAGNYFRTPEQAQEAAKRIKATLDAYHEEIGE